MKYLVWVAVVAGLCMSTVSRTAADTINTMLDETRFPNFANNATTIPVPWTMPFNVKASDDQRATGTLVFSNMSNDGRIDLLDLHDFGFSIPPTATIDGIEVLAERQASATGVTGRVVLRKPLGMSTWQEIIRDSTNIWPVGTDSVETFGSGNDLWGTTWTPADINSSEFGIYFRARSNSGGETVAVDSIRVVVHYSDTITVNGVSAGSNAAIAVLIMIVLAIASREVARHTRTL